MDKSVKISDNVGGKVNDVAEKRFGTEHFWPVTGDFERQMDQAARILRAFTGESGGLFRRGGGGGGEALRGEREEWRSLYLKGVTERRTRLHPEILADNILVEGVVTEEKVKNPNQGGTTANKGKKVIRKIPPQVIAEAKGLAIFTSMRTGIAPFGGAGGAGVVIAKLPNGGEGVILGSADVEIGLVLLPYHPITYPQVYVSPVAFPEVLARLIPAVSPRCRRLRVRPRYPFPESPRHFLHTQGDDRS